LAGNTDKGERMLLFLRASCMKKDLSSERSLPDYFSSPNSFL
jgi:hypothetical protein